MTTRRPYLHFYPIDYREDTFDLTPEEHGVYLILIMMAWGRTNCAIPNDMDWLKHAMTGWCRGLQHGNSFNAIVPPILKRFWGLENGEWIQNRLRIELQILEKRSRNGRENVQKRWEKSNKNNETFDSVVNSVVSESKCYSDSDSDSDKKEEKKTNKKKKPLGQAELDILFERFYSLYPKRADPLVARRKFETIIKSGVDPELIFAGAERFAEAHRKAATEKQFIPAPAVWLNRGGWLSEDLPESRKISIGNGHCAEPAVDFSGIDQKTLDIWDAHAAKFKQKQH